MQPRKTSTARLIFRIIFGGYSAAFHDRPLGCGRQIFALVVLISVTGAGYLLIEAAVFPWGRSLTGAPTLTGRWIGEMTTPTGQKKVMVLEIDGPYFGEGCTACEFEGTAILCGRDTQKYTVGGDATNHSGTRFYFNATKEDERRYGTRLRKVDGEWDRADRLRLTTMLESDIGGESLGAERLPSGAEKLVAYNTHPDSRAGITFTLHRATKKDAAPCAR
jgi:hypothetical protein